MRRSEEGGKQKHAQTNYTRHGCSKQGMLGKSTWTLLPDPELGEG